LGGREGPQRRAGSGPGGMAEKEEVPEASGPPKSLAPAEPEAKDDDGMPEVDFAALRAKVAEPTAPPAAPENEDDDEMPEIDFAALRAKVAEPQAPAPEPEPELPFSFVVDSCTMQGRRPKQEDRHVKIPDLTKAAKALKMPIDHLEQPCAFFSVYDGHQGSNCSEFVAKNFHVKLLKRLSADTNSESWTEDRISGAMKDICQELDTEFLAKFRTALDGSTLVVALITGTKLFTTWVGDSRLVLCQRGEHEQLLATSVTEDHRPGVQPKEGSVDEFEWNAEAQRVVDAGGIVVNFGEGMYRVAHDGYEEKLREMRRNMALGFGIVNKEPIALAVSRAIGDREFKAVTGKALLIPTPEVKCTQLDRTHKLMAVMCDGITDVMKHVEVGEELDKQRPGPPDPVKRCRVACGALVQEAYNRGSEDNLTVIFVRFQWKGGYEEAPLPKDHPVAIALAEAAKSAAKGDSAAVASKKRRLEANAAVSKQKLAAYERAMAQESGKVVDAPAKEPAPEPDAKVAKVEENGAPPKPVEEEKKAEEEDDSMTFL